uniref:Uncharacterized protein n=1 Tax=Heliothis virescens TaxID=7102 RepID=A0A2A4J1A2_HELVI
MGIGLGYNYCFVDLRTRVKYVPAHYQYKGSPRWPYLREGDPGSAAAQELEDAEDANLRSRLTPQPQELYIPTTLDDFDVQQDNNLTLPIVVHNVSEPIDIDDDDFTVASSNTTAIAETTSEQIIETDETTTKEPEDDIETTVSTSEELHSSPLFSVQEPDMINELDEPTPEAPTNSSDANNRRVKKLVIPISGLDLISLLSKLRAENKNYSLQIVTT